MIYIIAAISLLPALTTLVALAFLKGDGIRRWYFRTFRQCQYGSCSAPATTRYADSRVCQSCARAMDAKAEEGWERRMIDREKEKLRIMAKARAEFEAEQAGSYRD